ncbi:hypothetical protein [Methanococcoides methylutens]|uniref:Uncharacterized protein n=1 Tax=Methanococcoides methylutens MM1 TaxID=1434104 RepID=A0A0E3SR14_METMT|nr:hypothetical protein [Methanococcoides methylutens]AKB85226.1 hypothetical protein MCMEM_1173 [Methanococcoides methylutens MM1]
MVKKVVKTFSCLAVLLMMIVSSLPSDALAAEDDVKFDNKGMPVSEMERYGNMSRSDSEMDKPAKMNDEILEFETEEEEFEYFQNDLFELIDKWISDLENRKENLDEIDNEKMTSENLDEQIEVLNGVREEVESAESLEELEEIRGSIIISPMEENNKLRSENINRSDSGIDVDNKVTQKESEFKNEEGTFESIKKRVFGFIDKLF